MDRSPTFRDLFPVLPCITKHLDDPCDYANVTATCRDFYIARAVSDWPQILQKAYGEDVLFAHDVFPDPMPLAKVEPLPRPWLTGQNGEPLMRILLECGGTNKTIVRREGGFCGGPKLGCVPFRVPDIDPYDCHCYSPHFGLRGPGMLGNALYETPSYVAVAICSRWLEVLEVFLRRGMVEIQNVLTICVGLGFCDVVEGVVAHGAVHVLNQTDWKKCFKCGYRIWKGGHRRFRVKEGGKDRRRRSRVEHAFFRPDEMEGT